MPPPITTISYRSFTREHPSSRENGRDGVYARPGGLEVTRGRSRLRELACAQSDPAIQPAVGGAIGGLRRHRIFDERSEADRSIDVPEPTSREVARDGPAIRAGRM